MIEIHIISFHGGDARRLDRDGNGREDKCREDELLHLFPPSGSRFGVRRSSQGATEPTGAGEGWSRARQSVVCPSDEAVILCDNCWHESSRQSSTDLRPCPQGGSNSETRAL